MKENLEEFESEFSEEEKEAIRRSSMINTYRLLASNYDFSIFPDDIFWLLSDYKDQNVFDLLLEYFEGTEEYEICADIKKMHDTYLRIKDSRDAKKNKMIKYLISPKNEK